MITGVKIVIKSGNQILFVKSKKYWTLPGGLKEKGETEKQCLFRELSEELPGLELGPIVREGEYKRDEWNSAVYSTTIRNDQKIKIAREIVDYKWILPSEVGKLSEYWVDYFHSLF